MKHEIFPPDRAKSGLHILHLYDITIDGTRAYVVFWCPDRGWNARNASFPFTEHCRYGFKVKMYASDLQLALAAKAAGSMR